MSPDIPGPAKFLILSYLLYDTVLAIDPFGAELSSLQTAVILLASRLGAGRVGLIGASQKGDKEARFLKLYF